MLDGGSTCRMLVLIIAFNIDWRLEEDPRSTDSIKYGMDFRIIDNNIIIGMTDFTDVKFWSFL